MTLAIIIPVKRDLRVIKRVNDLYKNIDINRNQSLLLNYKIVVIDDSSSRVIKSSVEAIGANYISKGTQGKGDAVYWGLKCIESDYYLIVDSDDSVDISSIQSLLYGSRGVLDVDLFYGVRVFRNINRFRRIIGLCQLLCANLFLLSSFVQDTQCPLKLINRNLRNILIANLAIRGGMYDTLLFYYAEKYQLKRQAIPINWNDEKSSLNIRSIIFRDIYDVLTYKFRAKLSTRFFNSKRLERR